MCGFLIRTAFARGAQAEEEKMGEKCISCWKCPGKSREIHSVLIVTGEILGKGTNFDEAW